MSCATALSDQHEMLAASWCRTALFVAGAKPGGGPGGGVKDTPGVVAGVVGLMHFASCLL